MVSSIHHAPKVAVSSPRPLADWTDEALLAAYRQARDRQAFAELVQRYEHELFSYLRRYLGDAAAAEDAFQATFLQVHLKANLFEDGRPVRPWLYTIAMNQAIDAQRRGRRHRAVSLDRQRNEDAENTGNSLLQVLESREVEPAERMNSDERSRWTQQAVANLPDTLRAAVTLIYYQGLKYREAGDVLGVPEGTIKSRVHAALLKLNQAWNATHVADEQTSDA